MTRKKKFFGAVLFSVALGSSLASPSARAADIDYGKPGTPVHLVVGYQPYDSQLWSAVVLNSLQLWKKYLPAGSTVEFRPALQGSIIVNNMLAGKESIGYLGDTPAIVGASKANIASLRIVANAGLSHDQCNTLLVAANAPKFADANAAAAWLNGKTVAAPKGSCSDRFIRSIFQKANVTPSAYLNQSIEVITSGFRAGKLDAAVVWEPTTTRLVEEGLARRVATGNDFHEWDGGFVEARGDLIQERPDVVKGFLEAELEAEQYVADPKNEAQVVKFAQQQTTGLTPKILWKSLFGTYTAAQGGNSVRNYLPFGFSDDTLALIKKDTAFLYSIKSIGVSQLPANAVDTAPTDEILKERGLKVPVGQINAQPESAFQ